MASSEIVEGLRACEMFASLSEEETQQLTASLANEYQVEAYNAGDTIFTQGEHLARFYIIVEGQVLVQRSVNLGNRTAMWPIGLLRKGGIMGWSALLYGPRDVKASATCQKPTRVISMEGTTLRSVLGKEAGIGFKVIEQLACILGNRLRTAIGTMESHL